MEISKLITLLEKCKEEFGNIQVKQEQYDMLWNVNLKYEEADNVLLIV